MVCAIRVSRNKRVASAHRDSLRAKPIQVYRVCMLLMNGGFAMAILLPFSGRSAVAVPAMSVSGGCALYIGRFRA
jgi:hypothetical protein